MLLRILFVVLLVGCVDETCQKCVETCAPFAVASCDPHHGADHTYVLCECAVGATR